MEETVGVITEQGDLGLGFNPVSSEEAEKIKENAYRQGNDKETEFGN